MINYFALLFESVVMTLQNILNGNIIISLKNVKLSHVPVHEIFF